MQHMGRSGQQQIAQTVCARRLTFGRWLSPRSRDFPRPREDTGKTGFRATRKAAQMPISY